MRPSPFYWFAGIASWPFIKWLYRLRAEGVENVPPEGGFVLAANHLSNFDPWPLGIPLFPKRYLRFMAKSELFWWPLGPLIRSGGAFQVRRGEADIEAMNKAVDLVREGHIVVMFPHGTRQRKGLVKKHQPRPHSGAARIALEAHVPLVPAAISRARWTVPSSSASSRTSSRSGARRRPRRPPKRSSRRRPRSPSRAPPATSRSFSSRTSM